jgi:hypothetical protein
MESTASTGACGQSRGRCDSGGNGARQAVARARARALGSASAGVVRTNKSGWAGAGHWAARWATRGWAGKAAGPLCVRIRVGRGLERRQAGQAEVRCASWAGRPARGKKMRKGKEK